MSMPSASMTCPILDQRFENRIAVAVCEQFNKLPAKSKPRTRSNGIREWVPLSGIVIGHENGDLECVALATGMKCLPAANVPQAAGFVLHDWHAEILALRALNHFLIHECTTLASTPFSTSSVVRRKEVLGLSGSQGPQPFTVREDVKIYMYCSEAPCGDASMELIMEAQDDATPWTVDECNAGQETKSIPLYGRGYFSELGRVRRKPCIISFVGRFAEDELMMSAARPDSPQTLSKSCSDKLALKQCTSVLSSFACLLISPEHAYIENLVLPSSQFRAVACDRAFSPTGRMQAVHRASWADGFAYRPFNILTTSHEFDYSRRSMALQQGKVNGSNISAVWNPCIQETLLNGVLQGRKQTDPRGGSSLCNRRIAKLASELAGILKLQYLDQCIQYRIYSDLKQGTILKERRRAKGDVRKAALQGWTQNEGDDFALEQ